MKMKKTRVLLVSPVGEMGGAEQVFLSLAKYLPRWDVEPVLACLRPGPLMEIARRQGVAAHAFRCHRYRQIGTVMRGAHWLARLVWETGIDLLHCNHAAHVYSALAGLLTRVPEIWHIHDYPYKRDSLDLLSRRLRADYVLFTTERVKSGYPDLHGRPHAVVPPSCIEVERLRAIPSQREIRKKYELPPGPLFLTVARLQEHKGHRHLIDAVPDVVRSCPGAIFAVVGKASGPEQENYRQSLLAECARRGIGERVRFLGYVGEEDLVSLYREAAALVHPATSEGFGLTLLEAMALGTPVIAARADGPSEMLGDGEAGLLVPTGDSAALARSMVTLLENPSLAESLRREGSCRAERFRVENMVQQTVDVYRRLLEERSAA